MRAAGPRVGVTRQPSPLPRGPRAGVCAALALLLFTLLLLPRPTIAQDRGNGWDFADDALVDLWFHGLATVGYLGFGPTPLYDPGYAMASRARLGAAGIAPTALERAAPALRKAFEGDAAFEVLHFVPLYLRGATPLDAIRMLRADGTVVQALLPEVGQRQLLATFLDALEEEWRTVVEPRREADHLASGDRLKRLRTRWTTAWAPALSSFLDDEDRSSGLVLVSPALGSEGRFLDRDPAWPSRVLVAVGVPEGEGGLDAALSSLVRELCYPAVRRAFQPFEARLPNRMDASRASDLAATRCGELLLEERAPEHVAAYRSRFDLPEGGMGRGFLSASGRVPGAAAWEAELDRALRRELNLDLDAVRTDVRPVGRN